MCYHLIEKFAFEGIEFNDPERGINGSTPGEIITVVEHGLVEYSLLGYHTQTQSDLKYRRPKDFPRNKKERIAKMIQAKMRFLMISK